MTKFMGKAVASVFALGMMASSAFAVTQTISFTDTDAAGGFEVSSFNSALGTLLSAVYEGELNAQSTVVTSPAGGIGDGFAFASMTFLGDNATAVVSAPGVADGTIVSAQATLGPTSVGSLASVTDMGTLVATLSAANQFAATPGFLTITYTYDDGVAAPVPLPAGAPLLVAGMGAFAFMRRRQAKK
ncbi:MAG: VPLPA-CTERM sorting domain-containing protein [Aliishimia sp.]